MRFCLGTAVVSAILLSGCSADYLNHYDGVTLAAGDANHANLLMQTVDPFNPNSQNTHIEGDGARSVAVVQQLRGGSVSKPYAGNCETPSDTAKDGSNCGGRAASVKPGGAM